VVGTDEWDNAGFTLPPIPQTVREKISDLVTSEAGLILNNPLDLSAFAYTESFSYLIKRLANYEGFADLFVVHRGFGHAAWFSPLAYGAEVNYFTDAIIKIHSEVDMPVALVVQYLISTWDWQKGLDDFQQPCSEAGIPVYYSMASAAKAIDRFMRYHERREAGRDWENSKY